MTSSPTTSYPVRFDVDYAPQHERLSSALRIFWIIPILIVLSSVSGGTNAWEREGTRYASSAAGGIVVFGPLLMVVFRQKYPRWWFDWNLALSRFSARVFSYGALLRDEYPSTDEEQAVHLEIDYPDVPNDLNRWLPLVKWLLAIPHYIALFFLVIGAIFAVIGAWFAIVFTGSYPRPLFDYVVGVMRWGERVGGYAFLMVTDAYPPFSLQ